MTIKQLKNIPKTLTIACANIQISPNKQNKLITFKLNDITIQIGKRKIIGIYSQQKVGKKKGAYLIEAKSKEELEKTIFDKRRDIYSRIDAAIVKVARALGIAIPLKPPSTIRYEDSLKGEEYIDNLPNDLTIHTPVVKKVYPDEVEFIKNRNLPEGGVAVANYLENRALEKVAPEIHQELKQIHDKLDNMQDQQAIITEFAYYLFKHRWLPEGIHLNKLIKQYLSR